MCNCWTYLAQDCIHLAVTQGRQHLRSAAKLILCVAKIHSYSFFSLLAGKYPESLELAKIAMKLEEKELGKRPERMVEVYSLLTDIYDEVIMSCLHLHFSGLDPTMGRVAAFP